MPRYFYRQNCHVCDKPMITEEVSPSQFNLYVAKGSHACVEEVDGYRGKNNVVYDKDQDICNACVDAAPLPDYV